jgi:NAD(P)-dependent dehydrogenase (short-subunit alcohol dehydrogenase family)
MKTIVITGASDGIGAYSAKELKNLGHNIIIVGRNKQKTQNLATELNCPYHLADFSKISDVYRLIDELNAYPTIDVLVNNAGAVMGERTETENGIEKTFQVNVVGAYILTMGLIDKLISSKATVIQTSSLASRFVSKAYDLSDYQNKLGYSAVKAYAESKLCNILFTKQLDKLYGDKGLNAVAFEPGIPRTNFASDGFWFFKVAYHTPLKYLFTISPKKSSKRLLRLILGKPSVDFKNGEVYSYKKPFKLKRNDLDILAPKLWGILEDISKGIQK